VQLPLALKQSLLENAVFQGVLKAYNMRLVVFHVASKNCKSTPDCTTSKTSAPTWLDVIRSRLNLVPWIYCSLFRLSGMDNDEVPTTIHNGSRNVSHMGKETGSSEATTDTPVTKLEPQPRRAFRSVMISHISIPPVQFADGDEGNPRNWAPNRKIAIGVFVIVAGFVAYAPILFCFCIVLRLTPLLYFRYKFYGSSLN
jgi:hypothetical protein